MSISDDATILSFTSLSLEGPEKGLRQMDGFAGNIEKMTEENDLFRKVLYTGKNIQLVLMAIQPGDEIGEEVHEDRDQL